jgi:hypothetical protein
VKGGNGRGFSDKCDVSLTIPVEARCVTGSHPVTASVPASARWHPELQQDGARTHSCRVSTSGLCVMRPFDRNVTPRTFQIAGGYTPLCPSDPPRLLALFRLKYMTIVKGMIVTVDGRRRCSAPARSSAARSPRRDAGTRCRARDYLPVVCALHVGPSVAQVQLAAARFALCAAR